MPVSGDEGVLSPVELLLQASARLTHVLSQSLPENIRKELEALSENLQEVTPGVLQVMGARSRGIWRACEACTPEDVLEAELAREVSGFQCPRGAGCQECGNLGARWSPPRHNLEQTQGEGALMANKFSPDWSLLNATQESLREHMAKIQELQRELRGAPRPLLYGYATRLPGARDEIVLNPGDSRLVTQRAVTAVYSLAKA